jgi:hypothetical protein
MCAVHDCRKASITWIRAAGANVHVEISSGAVGCKWGGRRGVREGRGGLG